MLKQLWLTGVLVAFSTFGIKVGLGIGYHVYNRRISVRKKILIPAATLILYLVLFFSLFFVITRFNLLNYLNHIVNLLQYGMVVHLLTALGLGFWGVKILSGKPDDHGAFATHAGLLLIIPCPVCASVILLNLSFACAFITLPAALTTLTLFIVFAAIALTTTVMLYPFRNNIASGNTFLGLAMCLTALYFILTVIIAPIYPEVKAAFTMAVSNNPTGQTDPVHTAVLLIVTVILGLFGYVKMK